MKHTFTKNSWSLSRLPFYLFHFYGVILYYSIYPSIAIQYFLLTVSIGIKVVKESPEKKTDLTRKLLVITILLIYEFVSFYQ